MKRLFTITFFVTFFSSILFGQFKEDLNKKVDIRQGIISQQPSTSLFNSFFNPNNFNMSHSVSMSYTAFGSQGVALGVYTNSMSYQFNENLNVEVDASLVNSPYSSFGNQFNDQINGIYLSRAQINYKPSENTFLSIQYLNGPINYSPYSYYNRGFFSFRNTWFNRDNEFFDN